MSVKRQATSELNHENWDQDDPSDNDEMGQFKPAPKDVLEKRVIRTAKRRFTTKDDEAKKTVFSGFGGFNKPPPSSFDFLANLTNGNKSNGATSSKSETTLTSGLFTTKTETTQTSSGLFGSKIETTPTSGLFGSKTPKTSLHTSSSTHSDNETQSTSKADSSSSETSFKSQTTSSSAKSTQPNTLFSITPATNTQATSPFGIPCASNNKPLFSLSSNSPFKINQPSTTEAKTSEVSKPAVKSDSISEEKVDEKKLKYYTKLKGLNESVSDWIKKHVEETPLCILTPIFNDYDKYLKEIQDEYNRSEEKSFNAAGKEEPNNTKKPEPKPNPSSKSGIFGGTLTSTSTPKPNPLTQKQTDSSTGKTTGFSFGISNAPTTTSNKTSMPTFTSNTTAAPSGGFSFGIKPQATTTTTSLFTATTTTTSLFTLPTNTTTGTSKPFSFGTGKPFSFNSNIQKPAEEKKEDNENEDEEEPPKVEFTPVVEENSVFDKRCKIFVKKDGNFIDKGVGTLYIKRIEENDKHQLLVRANTNLGNILLNLILTSSIPTQRLGKNNVMMVCIPTPESKPPPTPVLIRVKTSEEADQLLETLNKYKA